MSVSDSTIADHYSTGGLLLRILNGFRECGKDPKALVPEDLVPVEHYHTGGAPATARLLAQLDLGPETHVIDIGCGIGGVSRAVAHTSGARVLGVDLTPDFVETARILSRIVGLDHLTEFEVGSGTNLPVKDRFFDVAALVHVGMNVADKDALFAEAFRVLHPGGLFAVYDVMEGPEPGALEFPLPWASEETSSFVAAKATYHQAAAQAGFELFRETDYHDAALKRQETHPATADPGPLGQHLMMGETAPEKIANYARMIRSGRVAPVEMLFRRPRAEP